MRIISMNRLTSVSLLAMLVASSSKVVHAHQHRDGESKSQQSDGERYDMRHLKRERMHKYLLERVDSNDDGKIDLNEYLANAEQRFKNMDIDGDGYVTTEEHRESGKLMREKHREMKKQLREASRAAQKESAESDSTH